jgi:hypothetical protein
MPKLKIPGESPVVDFDYFRIEKNTSYNYDIASKLATILMAETNIDDLHGFNDVDGIFYASTVGTGGSGMNMACFSLGAQRACLASLFSSYAQRHHTSCHLAIAEYECLKVLLEEFEDGNHASHRDKLINENIELLSKVCHAFELAYAREVPGFLFTLIKNSK